MNYIAACLFLYFSHTLPSAPGARGRLVGWMGARIFRILYSIVSLGAVVWFVAAYGAATFSFQIYAPMPGAIWLALVVIPLSAVLIAGRLMTPYGSLADPVGARGIYRITRFPGSWGVALWAAAHLAATGDLKRVVAFGIFLAIAVTALLKNEYVLRRETSAEAKAFVRETGFFPFTVNFQEPQRFVPRNIGWKILAVGLGFVGLFLALHPVLFGVDPLGLIL